MATIGKVEISVKDTDVFRDLLFFTNKIISELGEEGCFPATIQKYKEEFELIITPKQKEER
ncbi:MAG: hypothetical protein V3U78_09925 [Thiotrichaceae bacterium]